MKKIRTLCATLILTAFGWQANAQYCAAGPSSTFDSNVGSVNLTGDAATAINYTGCPGVSGLEDLTGTQSVSVTSGSGYTANVQFGTCGGNYGSAGEAWIDWNQDFTFDPSESIGTWSGTPPTSLSSMVFTVPALAVNGNTVMRVIQQEGGSSPLNPCATFTWGSAVDFTVTVTGGFTITCPQPTTLTASSIAANTADLFWSEAALATEWEVELDTAGFAPTGIANNVGLTDTTFTATGLLANTSYDYYVRAVCGAGDSSFWVGPYGFTTLCSTYQAPYFEGFEANGLDCWSITSTSTGFSSYNWLQNSGTTGSFGTGPNGASSGSEYIYTEASSGSSGDSTRLESPIIDLTSIVNSQLKFDYHMFGVKIDTLYIQVNNGAGFVTIDSITGAQQNATADAWLTKVIDLSAYDGSTNFQVAFVIKSLGCCDGDISIDNIRIAETCVMPTSAIISSLTSSSTSLGWTTSGSAAVTWSIEYGPTGFIQGTGNTINGTTFNPHPLAGLIDGTTYDFYIISNCALGDKSPWAGPFNFTTFITGVDENTANNDVSIFPNPNNGVFSLKVNASDASVKVINTQGQIILTKKILKNNAKIDLSNNAKGIYFVTVTSNEAVTTQKVIVQ